MTQKLLPSLLRVALWVSGSGMATNLGVRPPKKAIILDKTAPIHSWGLRSTFLLPGGRIVIRAQEALACAHSPWTMRVMNWGWAQRAARARLPLYLLEDLSPPRAVWAISDAIQMRHSNSDGHKHSPQAFAKPIHSVFSRVFHDEIIARHKALCPPVMRSFGLHNFPQAHSNPTGLCHMWYLKHSKAQKQKG